MLDGMVPKGPAAHCRRFSHLLLLLLLLPLMLP
jgi:hypothetical protein